MNAPDHVAWVQNHKVHVVCRSRSSRKVLAAAGAKRSLWRPTRWTLRYRDRNEMAAILSRLRDSGFALEGGTGGWHPSAVFEELRQAGLVHGTYIELTWRGPGEPVVLER